MAITRTLLRAAARFEPDPARCVESVNNLLARENEQMLFVTLFYGVLDVMAGEPVYVNAGHPPLLLGGTSASARYLDATGDMALAVMEAFDPEDEAFGEDRLKRLCMRKRDAPPVESLMKRL